MARGRLPTGIVATGRFVVAFTHVTVASSPLTTQTSSPWAATATGEPPTWTVWVMRRVPGSMRATASAWFCTTQTASWLAAAPAGDRPRSVTSRM